MIRKSFRDNRLRPPYVVTGGTQPYYFVQTIVMLNDWLVVGRLKIKKF